MRSTHRPWRECAESHESTAANILPKCMRPVGDGANRPVTVCCVSLSIRGAKLRIYFFSPEKKYVMSVAVRGFLLDGIAVNYFFYISFSYDILLLELLYGKGWFAHEDLGRIVLGGLGV